MEAARHKLSEGAPAEGPALPGLRDRREGSNEHRDMQNDLCQNDL